MPTTNLPFFSLTLLFSFLLTSASGQEIPYGSCVKCWNPDSLGNHRAVIQLSQPAEVTHVIIPWRRHDRHPEDKQVIFTDSKGTKIQNVKRLGSNAEAGEFIFEPTAGAGTYYAYYLPYLSKGRSNYPSIRYVPLQEAANAEWLKKIGLTIGIASSVTNFESIDAWNSFYPMEVIATGAEVGQIATRFPEKKYFVFPEDRLHPVKMSALPSRWKNGPVAEFTATARRGENFTYQLAVYSLEQPLENVRIRFSKLATSDGKYIADDAMSCLMTDGITYDGKPFTKRVDVAQLKVQSMWCLINIPAATAPGNYNGTATVTISGLDATVINIHLTVEDQILIDHGTGEPSQQTRLTWLNSTLASNNEVIAPYVPMQVKGNTIYFLGRTLTLSKNGLPENITSLFTSEMTTIGDHPTRILASPFQLIAEGKNGKTSWESGGVQFTTTMPGKVAWSSSSSSSSGSLSLKVKGEIEFDGYVQYQMEIQAKEDVTLQDIRMEIPFHEKASSYMMGLGKTGGLRPDTLNWKWDVARKNQDGAWIGSVNAGLQFSLRDEKYIRPLNTNFYLQKPLLLPQSWGNENKGGIDVVKSGTRFIVKAYSGARNMRKGEVLNYNFNLLITPFHTLNTDFQWNGRFYHRYSPVDTVISKGSTVVNIHHATALNPYINYPFLSTEVMKAYFDEAHQKGLKVKIYNTVRELSNRAWETFPMRSLGTEIYSPGKGGGWSWLQEHLEENYIAAWFVPELQDAAIINSGMSRWHNYYVEGMNWLVQNVGIDGIYLDDVAFDRVTMKRIRRVLQSVRGPGIIDLHSANQYNKNDGFNNSANLYMEHFPYLNRLWFGEYFDYDKSPDFWLTEVSGIPFGLMGEMLEKGGNKWRGMLYGITNRMPYDGNDPSPIWKVWDSFGIQESEMLGYWIDHPAVTTDHAEILATVYKKKDAVLIAIASWAKDDITVELHIDWKKLGMQPLTHMEVPAINGYQSAQMTDPGKGLLIPKGKGLMILLK